MKSAWSAALAFAGLAGCGLNVQSPDLFLLTRTGQGRPVTVLVNDGGMIRCDGGAANKPLPDAMLIQARQLAQDLANDAKAKLRIPAGPGSVYLYTVKLPDGTISFPDKAGARRPELARAELFTLQALAGPCRSG